MSFRTARLSVMLMLALGMSLPLFAQTVVEEHWSPYDYPRSIPDGVKVHIIQKGDTLWDLSERYFNDPRLWPALYQANTYIRDPDLIYPGDPLVLDIGIVVDEESIEDNMADAGSGEDFSELDEFADASEDTGDTVSDRSETVTFDDGSSEFVILPAGDRADMECSTYLYPAEDRDVDLPFDLLVSGGENRLLDSFGYEEIVYLNRGKNQGVKAGEEYSVRRVLHEVFDVASRQGALRSRKPFLGFAIDQVARIKILAVQDDSATGMVSDSCNEVLVGDFLIPYEQEPIPLITELPVAERWQPFNDEGNGAIIITEDQLGAVGKDNLVNVNLGFEDNIAPGDIFIVYRDNPNNSRSKGVMLPPIYLGHGVALKTQENSSIVKLIESFFEMSVGDKVVPYHNAKKGQSQSDGG